jgi:RHS repeat-associated protein
VTDSYEYDAYGNEFTVSGSTPNEMMYRGEQYDPDLGLYYLRARYYNPATGRFMSRDPLEYKPLDPVRFVPLEPYREPLDSKKLHKYLYAGGDPVNLIDPRGLEGEEEEGELDAQVEKEAKSVESLLKYQKRSRNPFYCIATQGTEDYFDYIASIITCLADLEDE